MRAVAWAKRLRTGGAEGGANHQNHNSNFQKYKLEFHVKTIEDVPTKRPNDNVVFSWGRAAKISTTKPKVVDDLSR